MFCSSHKSKVVFHIWGYVKKIKKEFSKIFFGRSTKLFHKEVISDHKQHKCDYFIQDHLTFLNHVHVFVFTKQVPNMYQDSNHSDEVKPKKQNEVKSFGQKWTAPEG